jgi:hypothetical protein
MQAPKFRRAILMVRLNAPVGSNSAPHIPPKPHNPKRYKRSLRHCYVCGNRGARPLPGVTDNIRGSVFCSLRCAAQAAIDDFRKSNVTWCDDHKDWTDCLGNCCHCIREAGIRDKAEGVVSDDALRAAKAVRHG